MELQKLKHFGHPDITETTEMGGIDNTWASGAASRGFSQFRVGVGGGAREEMCQFKFDITGDQIMPLIHGQIIIAQEMTMFNSALS